MKIYEIKSEVKVPHSSKWFKSDYTDAGDVIFKNFMKQKFSNCKIDDPNNWKNIHSDFNYSFPQLQKIKIKLNSEKSKLDFTNDNEKIELEYAHITNIVRDCEKLRGRKGFIYNKYNGEIVTNAWLKMYELCCKYLDPILKDGGVLESFHLAEAPGNFLLAINHYIKVNYPDIRWTWTANTYNVKFYKNTKYFEDKYNIAKQYPHKWDYGCDKDGDITSHFNIAEYEKKYKNNNIKFITSDAKCVKKEIDFNNEELINIPVQVGQILNGLFLLKKGGTMILKHFTFLEAQSVCLLLLVKIYFEKVFIVKPISSKPANSETYLVCVNYKKYPTIHQKNKLLNYMNYIRNLNNKDGCPTLFKNCIPVKLLNEIINISEKLCETQIKYINKNLCAYNLYTGIEKSKIWNDMRKEHDITVEKWINLYNIDYLNESDKLIKYDHNKRYGIPSDKTRTYYQ